VGDNPRQLAFEYFRQLADMGEKVIYRSFDSPLPVSEMPQFMPEPPLQGNLGLDNFFKTTTLTELHRTIKDCHNCPLGDTRTNFVFGVGNPHAEIMFVGEAPGHDEDIKGEPFVGRAGQLLNKVLAALGLKREDVYIANILKCRPPNNRDPQPEEAETCEPYLVHQIKLIKPKIICCLGRIAAQRLLQTNMSLGQMRERWFNFHDTLLTVTYHPAAVLRSPAYKRPLWEDMQKVMEKLKEMRGEPLS
jgi:DNA polymerase